MNFDQIWTILTTVWGPIKNQLNYAQNLDDDFQKLKEDARDLNDQKASIEDKLNSGAGRTATNHAGETWLGRLEEIEKEIKEIERKYQQDDKCLGLCPNVISQIRLGKCVERASISVKARMNEYHEFGESFLCDAPPAVVEKVQQSNVSENTSIERNLQKLLGCIKNEKVHKVGIWGMGGIGKTTLMNALNNSSEVSTAFKFVILITVSKHGTVGSIQKEIADRLKLELSNEESEEKAARRILDYLTSKKLLLLLDDVWQSIDLDRVGIPDPNSQENGSKVILATRDVRVCNEMETDVNMNVPCLNKKEAWALFSRKAGAVSNSNSIKPYAEAIVDECNGLPLALNVLGGSLRNTHDIGVWRNALRELQSPTSCSTATKQDRVFSCLQFSIDRLGDGPIKQWFLFCALYPEDYKIRDEELIEYWRSEGLTEDARSVMAAYDKGCDMLNTLVQLSLLERAGSHEYVMHDMLRDLALRIASSKGDNVDKLLVRAGLGDQLPPVEEEWKEMKRISLMRNKLSSLPEAPDCPSLSTLLLLWNRELKNIPEMFFQYMTELRVLDLSFIGITSLPSSIGSLKNLRGLYLVGCVQLAMLPPQIGSLRMLQALRVINTGIKFLPAELSNLTHLICLLVTPSPLNTIKMPLGCISKLSSLEYLAISVRKDDEWWVNNIDAILDEVASLRNLAKVQLHFPKVVQFGHFLSSSWSWKNRKLLSFEFSVGDLLNSIYIRREVEPFACLKYSGRNDSNMIPGAIIDALHRSQELEVEHHGAMNRLSEFGLQNLKGLKRCLIKECGAVEVLAEGEESKEAVFSNLEELNLLGLQNLRNIVKQPVSPGCFANLHYLWVSRCNKLNYIFPWSMIKQLSQLEKLAVGACNELEYIVEENETDQQIVENQLQKLKYLNLTGLPKLVGADKILTLALSSIESIHITGCRRVKSLPGSLLKAGNLRQIACPKKWWDEWEDDTIKQELEPLLVPLSDQPLLPKSNLKSMFENILKKR